MLYVFTHTLCNKNRSIYYNIYMVFYYSTSSILQYFSRGQMSSWSGTQRTLTKSNKFLYLPLMCGCLTSSSMSCKNCCCYFCFFYHSTRAGSSLSLLLKQIVVIFVSNPQCRCGEVSRHTLRLCDTRWTGAQLQAHPGGHSLHSQHLQLPI